MASAIVVRLPGVRCVHYAGGHCLYDERLNPDYEQAWQCTELQRFSDMYDTLLEQAERFSLTPQAMHGMWESRVASVVPPGAGCEQYAPKGGCGGCKGGGCGGDDAEGDTDRHDVAADMGAHFVHMMGCRFAWRSACVLRMPACEGVCRHFTPHDA